MPSPTADYVNLQFPSSLSVTAGEATSLIYGRIYEAGVTEAAGASASVIAQVGYGPAGTDPQTSSAWVWVNATYSFQAGNDDEYQATLTVPAAGTYAYTYRFGIDNGVDPVVYTYADLNGAGSNPGLSFDPSQLGSLTVTASPNQQPAGGDETVASSQGDSYVFASSDFNFSDTDGDAFTAVVFTTLPAQGVLRYDNGVDPAFNLTAGAVVAVANIDAGYLSYVAPANSGGTTQTFTFQVRDDGGTADGGVNTDQTPNTFTIAINAPPTVTSHTESTSGITEASIAPNSGSTTLVQPFLTADVTDSDNGSLAGAVVRISSNFQSGDRLTINGATSGTLGSGISYSYDSATGIMTLSGANTFNNYEAAIILIRFNGSGDNPTAYGSATTRTVSWSVSDGADSSVEVNATVYVTGINDRPVNTVGSGVTVAEESSGTAITGISIFDVDSNPTTQDMVVTLSVSNGTISLLTNVAGGIVSGDTSGNGSGTVTITATQAEINATFAAAGGLTYTPNAGYNGPDALQVVTNDGGFNGNDPGLSGSGTSEEDSDTVAITVTAVNDAPTVAFTAPMSLVGGELAIGSEGYSYAQTPAVTALADGRYVVTWAVYPSDGTAGDSYAQILSSTGVAEGAAFRINTFTSGNQVHSVVTALPGGGFVAAWASSAQDGSGYGIYAQRFDSTGATVGSEFRVNSTTANAQYEPAITVLEDGGFVIVWQTFVSTTPNSWEIAGQRYNSSGVAVGSEFQVNSTTAGYQEAPSITGLANGGYVVVWESPDASNDGVFARIYNSAGTATGVQFQVNTQTNLGQYNATVTALDNGNFVVSWYSNVGGITARLYDANGNALTGEIIVGTGTGAAPAVTALADGAFLIVFGSDQFEFDGGIVGQVFSASGIAVGDRFQVNSTTANTQGYPAVAGSGDSALAVWMTLGSDGIYDVAGQLLDTGLFATEQSTQNLKGTMAVADADAGGATVTATLSVDYGILNVTAGTSGAIVSGSGTGTVTITGTLAQINALLGTDATSIVQYVANGDAPPASANLTLSVNDGGNTGSGGALTGSATESIAITGVNDAPVNAVPGAQSGYEYTNLIFSSANGNAIAISDVDAGSGWTTVSLSVANGTLSLSTVTGLTFSTGDGSTDTAMTFSGNIADLNAALDTLTYRGLPDFYGSDTLTITTSDNGSAGTGGALTDSDTVAINLTNVVSGAGTNDTLVGTAGNEVLYGYAGDDTLSGLAGNDVIDGGDGIDTASYSGASGSVIASLFVTGPQNTGSSGVDTLVGIENLTGSGFADRLSGDQGSNVLTGIAGDDILDGRAGADTMIGGTGSDKYFVDNAGDVIVEADGEGEDMVKAKVDYALTAGVAVEMLSTTNELGFDPLHLIGNEFDQRIFGNLGDNILEGRGGDDVMIGGGGTDTMVGGTGNDTFRVNETTIVIEVSGEGDDTVRATTSYTLADGVSVETLTTRNSAKTTAIDLTGNEFGNLIYGNAGANVLDGAGGNDRLVGLEGDDTLIGGAGFDTLNGGAGNDVFAFLDAIDSGVAAPDRILDFSSGADEIDLSAIDADSQSDGNQAFAFIGSEAFSGAAGELRYQVIGNDTYIYGDVDGDGSADLVIMVTGFQTLVIDDLSL